MNKIIKIYLYLKSKYLNSDYRRKYLNIKCRKNYLDINNLRKDEMEILFDKNTLSKRKREIRDHKIIIKDNVARWNLPNCNSLVSMPVALQLDKINVPIDLVKHRKKLI